MRKRGKTEEHGERKKKKKKKQLRQHNILGEYFISQHFSSGDV